MTKEYRVTQLHPNQSPKLWSAMNIEKLGWVRQESASEAPPWVRG